MIKVDFGNQVSNRYRKHIHNFYFLTPTINRKYTLLLGKGNETEVWKLKTHSNNQIIWKARKLFASKKARDSEYSYLWLLKHPKIVEVEISGITLFHGQLRYFLDLELCRTNLEDIISRRELFGGTNLVLWFIDLLSALEFIHRKDVIHNDIKPMNILLSTSGHMKICDFTHAQLASNKNVYIIGTQVYQAPEKINLEPYHFASDMWQLGLVVYLMVEGVHPFIDQEFNCSVSVDCLFQEYKMNIRKKTLTFSAKGSTIFSFPGSIHKSTVND